MRVPSAGVDERLQRVLDALPQPLDEPGVLAEALRSLIAAGADVIPLPGHGETLRRWQALAAVASHDVGLVKLYEGHTDALAILAELDGPAPLPGSAWAVWAAEAPNARVKARRTADGLSLAGCKAWCSGAAAVSHALLTVWLDNDVSCLAAVALDAPGVRVTERGWAAIGMAATGSVEVEFDDAEAVQVGAPGDYLNRPGFWHGGAGIAACWYGAAAGIAAAFSARTAGRHDDPLVALALGEVDLALDGAANRLRATAARLDASPDADALVWAMRARLGAEQAAEVTLRCATRTLGAGPLCRDAAFARRVTDLGVFIRQSHADRDFAALGRAVHEVHRGNPSFAL
ncbi:acyl-CoA dehydrogenase family protein [Chitinasiproducens palmae]|uniref:Acyl-CoA dehydrogenase n=1 Tax=Chitinasiproducens palmae TaxID=1770053 RepID=A0A1H2PN67_9BURK|nr:acyl-CoA dehydrogenase [Chitinasiproducens palmae]SDV48087.1 hypothetical protein SAMN05216551_104150 [Chitinasiproducens palmae]